MYQFYSHNILNLFLLCLVIGLTVAYAEVKNEEDSVEDGMPRMNPILNECITSGGELGVCLERGLCPQFPKSTLTKCDDGQTLCCPISRTSSDNVETYAARNTTRVCGMRNAHKDLGFIVGGTEASAHSYPWAAALYYNGNFICGATIISERFVLCAAHCIIEPYYWMFKVQVGAHKLSNSGRIVDVKSVRVHEDYDPDKMQNDVSLLELKQPLNFTNKNVAPVCLPSSDANPDDDVGLMATIVGWGTMYSGGQPSDTLMQVQVPVVSNVDCIASYLTMITDNQLCAGYQNGGKDSCQGDSGGSLCREINKKYVQIGIVSWGYGCAEPGYPGVYTRVSNYIDWITQHTG